MTATTPTVYAPTARAATYAPVTPATNWGPITSATVRDYVRSVRSSLVMVCISCASVIESIMYIELHLYHAIFLNSIENIVIVVLLYLGETVTQFRAFLCLGSKTFRVSIAMFIFPARTKDTGEIGLLYFHGDKNNPNIYDLITYTSPNNRYHNFKVSAYRSQDICR